MKKIQIPNSKIQIKFPIPLNHWRGYSSFGIRISSFPFCILSSVICILLFGGCKKEEGKVLAKVGNAVLTEKEFYSLIPSQYTGMLTPTQKKELLRRWIETELIYQEALKEKIDKDPDVRVLLKQMERELVANAFLEQYITKLGSVDEVSAREYFTAHSEEYNTERDAQELVVQDESLAHRILAKLNAGESFSKLAKEYSVSPSAERDGNIGYVRRGDFPQLPEFEVALFSLTKIGDIAGPIETNYGYHIVKLLGIRKIDKEVKYEDVREAVRNFLNLTSRKRALSALLDSLRQKKEIKENYSLLEQIELDNR